MYDIIIVGGGPAGLTAAIYGKRANKRVLVLESLAYGGQIINTLDIENYPTIEHISGYDFAINLYEQVKNLGADLKLEKVNKIIDNDEYKEVVTSKAVYKGKTVIIATGTKIRKLNVENEEKFIGKGISYCATCDGSFYKNKVVAVIGGGNTALEDALYLANIAKKVYLIHYKDKLRGNEVSINKLKEFENVQILYNYNVIGINGNDKLESIVIKNIINEKEIQLDGLFIAIGRIPENILIDKIDLTQKGYIASNEECKTNISGIFVAGDIRDKELRQLVTATSDGAVAASEAIKYLNNME